jgi:hypothetical protein
LLDEGGRDLLDRDGNVYTEAESIVTVVSIIPFNVGSYPSIGIATSHIPNPSCEDGSCDWDAQVPVSALRSM